MLYFHQHEERSEENVVEREKTERALERLREKSTALQEEYEAQCTLNQNEERSESSIRIRSITPEEQTMLSEIQNIRLDIKLLEEYLAGELNIEDVEGLNLKRSQEVLAEKKIALILEEEALRMKHRQYERIQKLIASA